MKQVPEMLSVGRFDDPAGEAASPATAWRRGFDVADVAAGHPFPRPDAVSDLLDKLDESHVAVSDGVASGKSTLCLLAAARWNREGRGRVYHTRQPVRDPEALGDRLRSATIGEDRRPVLVVENALADDGDAAETLVDELSNDDVAVLLELERADVDVATNAATEGGNRLQEHVGNALTLSEVPPVDTEEFAAAVAHYEERTGTTISSEIGTLYDTLRNETSEGNVLLHFAHWVGSPMEGESALDRDAQAAYESAAAADDELVLDTAVVAATLAAADLPLYPTFFFGLDADERAIDDALDSLLDVVLFYPSSGPHFNAQHPLWATRFLERIATHDRDATSRFARAIHAILELFDPEVREAARTWFDAESKHASHLLGGDRDGDDGDASSDGNEVAGRQGDEPADGTGRDGLLTSDARRRRLAVGTTGQVVDRVFGIGSSHPGLASLYGTCVDDALDLDAYCSPTTRVRAILERGRMYLDAGEYDHADAEFRHARDVLDDATDVPWKLADRLAVEQYVCRGRVAVRRSEYDPAHRYYQAAYDVARDLGDRTNRARSHLHLGVTEIKRGDLHAATAHLEASKRLFRDHGEHHRLAGVLQRLGVVYWQRGRLDDAERVLREGLDRFERAGDRVGVTKCLNNLGIVALERDDDDVASDRFEHSMQLCGDVGYRPGELKAYLNLGNVAVNRERYDVAAEHFENARSLAESLDDSEEAATALNNLGVVAVERGELDDAAEYYRRSLTRHRDVGDRQGEGRALNNLGEVDRERGRHGSAVDRLRESVRIRRETGNRVGEARSRHELGRCLVARGDDDAAREHLEDALATYESYDADEKAATVRDVLEDLDGGGS